MKFDALLEDKFKILLCFKMFPSRPLFLFYFRPFHTQFKCELKKALMMLYLGFEPGAAI